MGWSCNQDAAFTMDAMSALCIEQTGSSNKFRANGNEYFFETGREQRDGAICGTIYRYLPDGTHVRKSGGFRIEGNGKISRGPAIFKKLKILFVEFNGLRELWRGGEVTQENLAKYVIEWRKSYGPDGCNSHIGISEKIRFPAVEILDLDRKTLLVYQQPMFLVD